MRITGEIMEDQDIKAICKLHQLDCTKITKLLGSFEKELFFIDDTYLIRTSKKPMLDEYNKFDRIKHLKYTPKIIYSSDQELSSDKPYYLILDYLKGDELFSMYHELSDQKVHALAIEISDFLTDLHSIKGQNYDIGHYVPIIPGYDKSWKSGHKKYWDYIYRGIQNIQLSEDLQHLLKRTEEYINTNISSLDFENGPSLLHNDFHHKNIIMHNNTFSGVIDWECSQYGEVDFDIIHLLHWCLFPSKEIDMKHLFNTIFLMQMKECPIPMIEKRLTIYLLEHDFIQILWSKGKRAEEFLPRIKWWLSGNLEKYLQNLDKSLLATNSN